MVGIRIFLEIVFIHFIRLLLLPLPLSLVSLPGEALGQALFSVFRLQRRLTLENLNRAFGDEMDAAVRLKVAAKCYRHFGGVITEFITLARMSPAQVRSRVELENPQVLQAALDEGKGVLLIGGHMGNWELMSAAMVAAGIPYTMYVGRQKNPFADRFINAMRGAYGAGTVAKRGGMRGMIKALRGNQVLGLLSDQHFSRNRHFVRFFGLPVSVAPGPGALATHSRPPLVFAESWKVGRNRYHARFTRLELPEPSGNEEWDLLVVSQRISDAVEAAVRRHPEQYFWMHRRWREIPHDRQPTPVNRRFLEGASGPGSVPADPGSAEPDDLEDLDE